MNPTEQVFSFRFVENIKGTLKDDFSFGEFQPFYINIMQIMEVWSYWKCFDGKDLRKVVVMENMSEFRRTKLILPAGLFTKS